MLSGVAPLLLILATWIANASCADSDAWDSFNWVGKLGDDDNQTFYCGDDGAHKMELCQNRVYMLNKLFAADILGYCKYDWWLQQRDGTSMASKDGTHGQSGITEQRIPGLDADFTNVADAENTYLYAVRTLRVRAVSDVWLCSDPNCRIMQDVGFVRGNGSSDLDVFTASSYLHHTMVALPLVGKPANVKTHCEKVASSALPLDTALDAEHSNLCFADNKDVISPSANAFVPSMVPAYAAAAGVEKHLGPYGRLMVGTYLSNRGCVRLVLPRHAWLVQHGWDKQHDCKPEYDFIFISYFLPGWADLDNFNESKVVTDTAANMQKFHQYAYYLSYIRYARILWCDDDAMSSAFSGSLCSVEDLSGPFLEFTSLALENDRISNTIAWLVIEGIPVLAYNTTAGIKVTGPGVLAEDEMDYDNQDSGSNPVNSTQVGRWLFSADMLARDNSSTVPWCGNFADVLFSDSNLTEALPELSNSIDPYYSTSAPVSINFINGSTVTDGNDSSNCQLLDSMGLLTLRKATKPTEPFHSLLSPGLVTWKSYTGQTVDQQNMGFAGSEPLPPQAVVRAMLEAVQIVQISSKTLADRLISTADMTATGMGAALNLYAFSMLALVVLGTSADFVKAFAEDVLLYKKRWIWVLYVLPPITIIASLLPAPVLALLQEINARNNNPNGEVQVGFTQIVARGYGNYHLMIFTAYKSQALYRSYTLNCAVVAVVLASIGVVVATGYSVWATNKLKKYLDEKERKAAAKLAAKQGELGQIRKDPDVENLDAESDQDSDIEESDAGVSSGRAGKGVWFKCFRT